MLMMVLDTLDAEDKSKAEQLITRYQGLLYSIAYKMIGNEHMAEDIVIEAWIKILSHLDSVGEVEEKRTKGFLVTILENTAINEYNKNKKKLQREVVIEETSSYFAVEEQAFDHMELLEYIHAMERSYADVMLLYYVHGYKLHEIGTLLGISEATASRRLKKGEMQMKEYFLGGVQYEE